MALHVDAMRAALDLTYAATLNAEQWQELQNSPEFAVRNVHFRDTLHDGQMTFDYRLREGVVDTTNALRVMALAGIPVRMDGEAQAG